VWTAAQLAAFLDSVRQDRLYALWWLAALRGLRRSELAGLRWADLNLDHRQLVIVRARTTAGYQVFEGPPKSAASTRTIALDRHTITVLRQHARRQRQERNTAASRWQDTGYVFTNRHGDPLHPGFLTHRLAALVTAAGLPPIRLHDLRHGAAALAHLAGTDLKTIQDQLGHSSIVLTADTLHQRATRGTVQGCRSHRPAGARCRPQRPRQDRDCGAANPGRGTQISEGIASHTGSRPGSSQVTSLPDTRSDHQPWQPLGNHRTTTVHTELNKQL
jgi:integrase